MGFEVGDTVTVVDANRTLNGDQGIILEISPVGVLPVIVDLEQHGVVVFEPYELEKK